MRDGDKTRYFGKGVQKAVENVNKKIAKQIVGMNVYNQRKIDDTLIKLDDTPNKSNLGANSILRSINCCRKGSIRIFKYGII